MKKIIALLVAIALLFTLSACKKNKEILSDNSSDTIESVAFVKPDSYASVLTIKINPEFELYLDDSNDVIAINALNDDAKSFKDEIDLKDKNFEAVIKEILKTANQKGFIKADAKINFEATANAAVNITNILSKASTAAKDITVTLNLNVTINIVNEEEKTDSSSKEPTSSKANESPKPSTQTTVSSKTETLKAESTKQESNQSKPVESKPVESKPDTPTVVNPKTNLNTEKEYISSIVRKWTDEEVYSGGIGFDSECVILLQANYVLEGTDPDISPEASYITYEGKKYYRMGAGQSPCNFEITDTEIIVKNSLYDETEKIKAKMVLLSDGTLKVTYVDAEETDRFTVGEILK